MRLPALRSLLLGLTLAALVPGLALAAPSRHAKALREGNPHLAAGLGCADCHGKGTPAGAPSSATCLSCHGPVEKLVEKTAAVKPENPHASPHWGTAMDCTVCHRQHEATVNWCAHCHGFDVKVP